MARKKKSTSDHDPRWTSDLKPAPGDLRVVQAFLNTADPARGRTSPRVLAECVELWGLVPPGTELSESDLGKAIEVRDALRAVIATQHAKTVDEAAVARLDRAMAHATVRVRYGTGGRVRSVA